MILFFASVPHWWWPSAGARWIPLCCGRECTNGSDRLDVVVNNMGTEQTVLAVVVDVDHLQAVTLVPVRGRSNPMAGISITFHSGNSDTLYKLK